MSHRRLLARLGLLCGGLLVGCALAEVTARLIQPNGSSDFLFGAPEATPEGLYVHDPYVMMKPAPGFEATSGSLGYSVPLRINSLGLRGPELSPDDPTRWLATGDSFTMAAQVREERTFLALAGQTLDISFLNSGVDGYSTWQALRRYEQLDDTVGASGVLHTLFLGNDLADNERSGPAPSSTPAPHLVPGEPIPRERRPLIVTLLARHSYLYAHLAVWTRVAAIRAGSDEQIEFRRKELLIFTPEGSADLARLLPTTRAALASLRDVVRAHGDELVVSIAPPAFAVHPERAQDTLPLYGLQVDSQALQAPGQAVLALLDELGIVGCDTSAPLAAAVAAGAEPYFVFDGHWNPEGHRVVAQAIEGCMSRRLEGDSSP